MKDEMNEENPIGMPKILIPSKGVLNQNGNFKIDKVTKWKASHACDWSENSCESS